MYASPKASSTLHFHQRRMLCFHAGFIGLHSLYLQSKKKFSKRLVMEAFIHYPYVCSDMLMCHFTVDSIISILIEKGFFDKESYEKHRILTLIDIQRVWLEDTVLRKSWLTKLPYLLEEVKCKEEEIKCKQKESSNSENADIFRQSKVKESKVEEKKKREEDSALPPPPEYAFNKKTHNYDGLLLALDRIKVTEVGDIKAILRMSNYGEIGTPVWKVLAQTSWAKIGMPGKYLIKILRSS